jgi:hypothetical protein
MNNKVSVEKTRVMNLREYLIEIIDDLSENKDYQINANMLSNNPNNYSLDKIPVASTIERWIMGIEVHKDVYSFRSRMDYSQNTMDNLINVGFFEKFEETILSNNNKKKLPNIQGIESIECLNCGSMNNAESNTCEFDIQLQIKYKVGGNNETDNSEN